MIKWKRNLKRKTKQKGCLTGNKSKLLPPMWTKLWLRLYRNWIEMLTVAKLPWCISLFFNSYSSNSYIFNIFPPWSLIKTCRTFCFVCLISSWCVSFVSGWMMAERLHDGERGWFPSRVVEEIHSKEVRTQNLKEAIRIQLAYEVGAGSQSGARLGLRAGRRTPKSLNAFGSWTERNSEGKQWMNVCMKKQMH